MPNTSSCTLRSSAIALGSAAGYAGIGSGVGGHWGSWYTVGIRRRRSEIF